MSLEPNREPYPYNPSQEPHPYNLSHEPGAPELEARGSRLEVRGSRGSEYMGLLWLAVRGSYAY